MRSDLGLREAVGHFHLYAWLREAVGDQCRVSPEFPTGNGRVALLLDCENRRATIEVKSFQNMAKLQRARLQAAEHGQKTGVRTVSLALFVPSEDYEVLQALSTVETFDQITVKTSAIAWG